jgi:hypothetical protein
MLETMGRQHSEEEYLRRTAAVPPRRSMVPWAAAAAAALIAAAGLYLAFGRRDSAVPDREPPAVAETKITPVEPVTEETPPAAMLAEGPVLFEDDFSAGLAEWRIAKASRPLVTIETVERKGAATECVVLDTYGQGETQAAIAPKKRLTAANLSIEYDYRISEPGGSICPFFGFVVGKPAALKGIGTVPPKKAAAIGDRTGKWVHARFELFGMRCPKAGPFVWVRKFENGRPVNSYYVPCGMKDLRIGTFWTVNARVAVDNVMIREMRPLTEPSGR